MKVLIVFASVVVLASAYRWNSGSGSSVLSDPSHTYLPQKVGYVQHQPVSGYGGYGTSGSGSGIYQDYGYGSGSSGYAGSGSGSAYGGGSFGSSGFGSGGYSGVNSGHSGGLGFGSGGAYHDAGTYAGNFGHTTIVKQTAPLVTKSSYVFAAPEDKEDYQRDQTLVLPRPKQHYNVVFIKAPTSTIINTPSTAVGGQQQEKTLIYVLSDKKRIENHIDVPEIDQAKLQKPEVFFIKHNHPTQHSHSKIQYQTVDSVHGAENGAINGVPNHVSGGGSAFQDEYSSPEQQQIAQAIFQSVQGGGIQSGVQTVEQLSGAGHSIGTFGGGSGSGSYGGGSYDTGSYGGGSYGGGSYGSSGKTYYDSVQQKPAQVHYTGLSPSSNYQSTGLGGGYTY